MDPCLFQSLLNTKLQHYAKIRIILCSICNLFLFKIYTYLFACQNKHDFYGSVTYSHAIQSGDLSFLRQLLLIRVVSLFIIAVAGASINSRVGAGAVGTVAHHCTSHVIEPSVNTTQPFRYNIKTFVDSFNLFLFS